MPMKRFPVEGPEGLRGTLLAKTRFFDGRDLKRLVLEGGESYMVPATRLVPRSDGSYELRMTREELLTNSRASHPLEAGRVPDHNPSDGPPSASSEAAETAVERRLPDTGRLQVTRKVSEHETTVDEPLMREGFDIKRVPVNRIVDKPVDTRYEGETMILPVLEEVLVVEKRLILREEIHITRKCEELRDSRRVMLRRDEIDVQSDPEA